MGGHGTPGERQFEAGAKVAPERGTHSLVCVHLDEPVLSQLTKVLIRIEKEIELQPLHDFGSGDSYHDFIGVNPNCSGRGVLESQVKLLRATTLSIAVYNRHNQVNQLLSRLIKDIGVVNDGLMHIHSEAESSSDPLVVFFANGHAEVPELLVLTGSLEGEKLEDERQTLPTL